MRLWSTHTKGPIMTTLQKTQQATERLEEAEKGEPVGGPAISINLDLQDLSSTGPPIKQCAPTHMKPPTHIQ
ncbi:hypothetical protein T4D_5139 [Trichinella pseudospiralis]|uniref:Uncharacterized protein n=1 Tax=Trichinella pseudospiralis TaxID=6337 RepID=A0A0V1DN86_TRIPS|nr:hypothetical protein T4D_5139 [Trichinella pseudospiralis]